MNIIVLSYVGWRPQTSVKHKVADDGGSKTYQQKLIINKKYNYDLRPGGKL